MNVNVISKTDNKVFERKEIEAEVSFDGPTPTRKELKEAISGKVGANPELVVLREVHNSFGKKTVKVVAHAYSKKEKMVETEPEYIVKRDSEEKKEEKPAEEKPKEEAKEEKPKEEKKEEPKKEEKPKEEKPKKEEKKQEKPKEEPKKEEKKEEPAEKKEEKKE